MIPPDVLLYAYRVGIFPMALDDGEIHWFSPDPRAILPLDRFHVPKRLQRVLRHNRFEIRVDHAFRDVMAACARHDDTWINDEIIESYVALHGLGFAHSVEAWQDETLVGGLYGVTLRGAFFGESMFHAATDASKVALVALVERLNDRQYALLDIQWQTEHLERFGAIEIPRAEYMTRLEAAMDRDCTF
jgi:leucyl/phenylalanyl-tRNA--protein transferase